MANHKISKEEFVRRYVELVKKKRLERGPCGITTLECYASGAKSQALLDWNFLYELGVILVDRS